ncbi:Protease HtpX [subsurface metagenome]
MSNLSEERKKELKNWLYVFAIFFIITLVFVPYIIPLLFQSPKEGFLVLLSFIMVGVMVALFSAYILTPLVMRKLKPFNDPEILEILEKLAEKAKMKNAPLLTMVDTPEINAVAYLSLLGRRVGITKGLIESYHKKAINKSELKSILAHELGHHNSLDCLKISFAFSIVSFYEAIGYLIIIMGRGIAYMGEYSDERAGCASTLLGWTVSLMGYILRIISKIAEIFAFHLTRKQEYSADSFGAGLTSPKTMAKALEKIENLNSELTAKEISGLPYTDRWQLQPVNPSWIDKLFDTHPPTRERVKTLLSK